MRNISTQAVRGPLARALACLAIVLVLSAVSCATDLTTASAPNDSPRDTAINLAAARSAAFASCTRVVLGPSNTYKTKTADVAVPVAFASSKSPVVTFVYYSSELRHGGPAQMASCDLPDDAQSATWFSARAAHGNLVSKVARTQQVALRLGLRTAADCDADHPEDCTLFEEACPVTQEECAGWAAGEEWEGPPPDDIDGVESGDFSFDDDSLHAGPSSFRIIGCEFATDNIHDTANQTEVSVHAWTSCRGESVFVWVATDLERQKAVLWFKWWELIGSGENSRSASSDVDVAVHASCVGKRYYRAFSSHAAGSYAGAFNMIFASSKAGPTEVQCALYADNTPSPSAY